MAEERYPALIKTSVLLSPDQMRRIARIRDRRNTPNTPLTKASVIREVIETGLVAHEQPEEGSPHEPIR